MLISGSCDLVYFLAYSFFFSPPQNAIQACAQLKPPSAHWDSKFILIFPVGSAVLHTNVVSPLEIYYNDKPYSFIYCII